ncbi:glutaredoxin family protein [Candidatus Bathyarchaeota archaeon]|nr:glutaredoxin family protein [Candidatus Bathyarchaeota archaeon]
MGLSEHCENLLSRGNKVVVYTSEGCPRCTLLKEWLKDRDTEFEEKNLEDVNVMTDLVMRNLVVLSAPALEVGDMVYTEDQIFEGDRLADAKILEILEGK